MLFKHNREILREIGLYSLGHSDDPFATYMSQMIRGIKGPDALGRGTREENLGFMIRALRTKLGHNQKEFAKLAGVDQTLISKIEHGKRRPSVMFYDFLAKITRETLNETLNLLDDEDLKQLLEDSVEDDLSRQPQ